MIVIHFRNTPQDCRCPPPAPNRTPACCPRHITPSRALWPFNTNTSHRARIIADRKSFARTALVNAGLQGAAGQVQGGGHSVWRVSLLRCRPAAGLGQSRGLSPAACDCRTHPSRPGPCALQQRRGAARSPDGAPGARCRGASDPRAPRAAGSAAALDAARGAARSPEDSGASSRAQATLAKGTVATECAAAVTQAVASRQAPAP
jgi:hypothetical protein